VGTVGADTDWRGYATPNKFNDLETKGKNPLSLFLSIYLLAYKLVKGFLGIY
jgi:hypothetical protein